MTYQANLPKVFPYMLRTSKATVRYMVREIIGRPIISNDDPGSSFAITTDNWDGTWNLWMSESTKDFVVSRHPHTEKTIIPVGELMSE